jgi:hypothetical protein
MLALKIGNDVKKLAWVLKSGEIVLSGFLKSRFSDPVTHHRFPCDICGKKFTRPQVKQFQSFTSDNFVDSAVDKIEWWFLKKLEMGTAFVLKFCSTSNHFKTTFPGLGSELIYFLLTKFYNKVDLGQRQL